VMECPAFWVKDPSILISQASEFFPFTEQDKRCTAAALNSFTRFGLYLAIILTIIRVDLRWVLIAPVFAGIAVAAWFYMDGHGSIREFFDGGYAEIVVEKPTGHDIVDSAQLDTRYTPDVIGVSGRTEPTAANPFMNVLISEISENPYRKPAADVQGVAVRASLDNYFDTMFASDPGDVFGKTQNQRMWVTQPSTTIPNDQESYQNWLYRVPGRTCKDGNLSVCNFATDGMIPWREIGPIS